MCVCVCVCVVCVYIYIYMYIYIYNLFKFVFNLVIRTNLKSPENETFDQVDLPGLRSKSIATLIETAERRLSIYTGYKSKRTAFKQNIQEW